MGVTGGIGAFLSRAHETEWECSGYEDCPSEESFVQCDTCFSSEDSLIFSDFNEKSNYGRSGSSGKSMQSTARVPVGLSSSALWLSVFFQLITGASGTVSDDTWRLLYGRLCALLSIGELFTPSSSDVVDSQSVRESLLSDVSDGSMLHMDLGDEYARVTSEKIKQICLKLARDVESRNSIPDSSILHGYFSGGCENGVSNLYECPNIGEYVVTPGSYFCRQYLVASVFLIVLFIVFLFVGFFFSEYLGCRRVFSSESDRTTRGVSQQTEVLSVDEDVCYENPDAL